MRIDLPAVIPDPCHVTRSQAQDIADAIVRLLDSRNRRLLRVYLGPDGVVGYSFDQGVSDDERFGPLSLVGAYTAESTARQIAEDILAMHREHIA